jgi:hypothetical protein
MSKVFCPNCYSEFEMQPHYCSCGYPFNGTEMDKYQFMSTKVKKAKILQEGINSASYSRNILFVIGGLNLLISIILAFLADDNEYNLINNDYYFITMGYSVILIALGFYSYKEPFFALLLGFLVLLFVYAIMGLINPIMLLNGIIIKIIIICSFVYGLIKIKQAENISKQ